MREFLTLIGIVAVLLSMSLFEQSMAGGIGESESDEGKGLRFEQWRPGYFDIHHISVDGDATFMIFPDGTTLLFDAGVRNKTAFEKRVPPLKSAVMRPNNQRRSGEWYADYIRPLLPDSDRPLDYMVISHFDSDHYGNLSLKSPKSQSGKYRLSGVTDIHDLLGIGTLIDRAYPDYDIPTDMRVVRRNNPTFQNYLQFLSHRDQAGLATQSAVIGSEDQIKPLINTDKAEDFSVRVVKSNHLGWTGREDGRFEIFDPADAVRDNGGFPENPFSLALKFDYGDFDYFTGGDMLGPPTYTHDAWMDAETPLADIIGEVDVFALNHHGVRDANNEKFVSALRPRISIMSGGTSDHPGQEVYYRLTSPTLFSGEKEFFATYVFDETLTTYGPWFADMLKGRVGHIVIRVYEQGASYSVYVLDSTRPGHHIKSSYGPYQSR